MTSTDSINDSVSDGEDSWVYPWRRPQKKGIFGTVTKMNALIMQTLSKYFLAHVWWLSFLPINMLFFLTIPDIRIGPKCAKFYLLSFISCICWIGAIAYVVTWMITIIGQVVNSGRKCVQHL